jgi:arabinose-5-phosphate isomerase
MLPQKSIQVAERVFDWGIINLLDAWSLIYTPEFEKAVKLLSTHRIWVTGMGKAGSIGHKFSSTLASNGRPAAYIHAGEALHGDFGAIQRGDVLVAISNSGRTDEVIRVAIKAKKIGAKVILLTGHPRTRLAEMADVVLCYGEIKEACPLGLTPTTSIIVILAICDALALAVQTTVGTTVEQYYTNHHAGYLGKKARRESRNGS